MSDGDDVTCERVLDDMASVLDGSAPTELLEHVAGCGACRDARPARRAPRRRGSVSELPEAWAPGLRQTPRVPASAAAPTSAAGAASSTPATTPTATAEAPNAAEAVPPKAATAPPKSAPTPE